MANPTNENESEGWRDQQDTREFIVKLIMENFRRYLLTEAAYGPEDLLKNVYVAIKEQADEITFYYSDYLGRREMSPFGYVDIAEYDGEGGEPCLGAYMVTGARADNGWGPMLYDVAMEFTGKRGLMADRLSLSKDAFKVWQFYMTRSDVQKRQLDDEQDTLTPDGNDNCLTDTGFQHADITKADFSDNWNDEKATEFLKNSPVMKVYTKGEGTIDKLEAIGRLIRK